MKHIDKRIQQLKQSDFILDTRVLLDESFKIYSKIVLKAGLSIMLIAFLSALLASGYITSNFPDPQQTLTELMQLNPLEFDLDQLALYVAGLSLATALGSVVAAGLIRMASQAYKGLPFGIATAFYYFKQKQGLYVFVAHFAITMVFTCISFLLEDLNLNMVAIAFNWILSSLTSLVTPILIFAKQPLLKAFKYSTDIINLKPLSIIFLLTWNSFLASAGVLFFVVGIFFTLPYIFCVYFALYNQTIGLEESKIS